VTDPGDAQFAVGSLEEVTSFGSNPAQLRMFQYIPSDMPDTPRPLMVALHGCSQSAAAYQTAGWNQMAELWKFYVLYPQQNSAVNNSMGCFNWGASWDGAPSTMVMNAPLHLEDLERGHSENQSIIEMVNHMKSTLQVDDNRVYASGVSAGGGFTAVMLATWPDVFAGGAIVAGVPYGCTILEGATTEQGTACVNAHPEGHELNRTAEGWGELVRRAYPGYSGPYPKVSIWQGTSDWMVAPELATELVEQWTNVHGIDMTPDATAQVGPAEHAEYKNSAGQTLVETYIIGGMGHGQPVDSAQECGGAGAFFNDVGLCTAEVAGEFFGLDQEGGDDPADPSAPIVDIISPISGSTLTGQVQIEASATDPDGIDRVDFYLDGGFHSSATSAPYKVAWDTGGAFPGEHRIRAVALDTTGAMGVDDDTSVFVQGEGGGNPDDPGDPDVEGGFQGCQTALDAQSVGALALISMLLLLLGRRRRA